MTADASAVAALTFDRALEELQTTVAQLEAGGQPLEESIVLYERGVALHEHCARLLADAELRVKRLVERAGGALDAIADGGGGGAVGAPAGSAATSAGSAGTSAGSGTGAAATDPR